MKQGMDIFATLQQAVDFHQQGDLDKAATLYDVVLALAPRNFDALHLSGVLARQRGQSLRALQLIEAAIAVDAGKPIAYCNRGAVLQDLQRHGEALASYDAALALYPRYAMALANRGNALRHLGRLDEALASYGQALAAQPHYPEALCNQGLALQQLARHTEALDSFGAALEKRRDYPEALLGAAVSLLALERPADALEGFERALQLQPAYAEAWCGRGVLLLRAQAFDDALASFDDALALRPDYARAQLGRANALRALGRRDAAVAAYRQALALGADPATVGFMLASLGAQDAPGTSPAAYVQALFDQYAGQFDRHLLDVLQYRTPGLLVAALQPQMAGRAGGVDVAIDLGCGTGLCGALLRPLAATLVGVDLSPQMLERARDLGLYDQLHCAELVAFLQARPGSADLLLAADVLVYVGDLNPLLAAARLALRPGGLLAFSVEALDGEGYALRPSGRYAHARGYVEALAGAHGFAVCTLEAATLRQDGGADVAGWLVVLAGR